MSDASGPQVTCRSLEPADYPVVREIIAGAFADHVRDNPEALARLDEEPWYDPHHLLVAEVDGEVVSHLGVRDSGIWLGGQLFPAGLVGTVCTREEVRGRGIGSQLLRHAFGWMADRGLALSLLHTGEKRYAFYERLGYRRAVIEQPRLMLDLAAARSSEASTVRPAEASDAEALNGLCAATYGRATGAWARSVEFWTRRLQGIPKLWSRVLQFRVAGEGGPRAYVAYEEVEGAGTVHELGCAAGAEREAVGLLEHLLAQWRERGFLVSELSLSASHPVRPLVERLVAEDRTGRDAVFIRVQDVERFVECVAPVLEGRAAEAGFELSVRPRGGAVAVEVSGDDAGPVELEATELAALVYNGRMAPSQEVLAASLVGRSWMAAVFPNTGAARCGLDAY